MSANLSVPDFVHRLATILLALAALVARRFLRDPFRAPLIVPLWKHLTRAARRLDRAFARLATSLPSRPRAAKPHSGLHSKPALPTRRGWLVAALGPEAAACASQIESLLAEPEAADALARSLAARRTLAPIRRMLGFVAPRRRQPRPRPLSSLLPFWEGSGEGFAPPPAARPWWLPPRRLRSG
jgi:hypothetical protein